MHEVLMIHGIDGLIVGQKCNVNLVNGTNCSCITPLTNSSVRLEPSHINAFSRDTGYTCNKATTITSDSVSGGKYLQYAVQVTVITSRDDDYC